MKCPHCGVWSSVLETRGAKRRRECANGHRFATVEAVVNDVAYRNKQIVAELRAGATQTEVARRYGLKAPSEVSRIAKRAGLTDNRSHAQARRWARIKTGSRNEHHARVP